MIMTDNQLSLVPKLDEFGFTVGQQKQQASASALHHTRFAETIE